MRRRCLDFEGTGKRKKDDQQTVYDNKAESSSKHVAPGIGLHLNAIAMVSRDSKINVRLTSGAIQKSFSDSNTPVQSQDSLLESLDQGEHEPGEESAVEELNPGSLRKKQAFLLQEKLHNRFVY